MIMQIIPVVNEMEILIQVAEIKNNFKNIIF
jgi:hypothetical protein